MTVSVIPDEYKELLLSHHPDLPCFKHDVIVLSGRRICAGCLLAYPTAVVIVLVFHPFWPESICYALFFAVVSQLRRVNRNNRLLGHYCRVLAGIAFGFGIGGLIWALNTGEWLMVALLVTGAGLYLLSRVYFMKKLVCPG